MEKYTLHHGDCLEILKNYPDNHFDSVICDPPYHLTTNKKGGSGEKSVNLNSPYGRARITTGNGSAGFMGEKWDGGDIAFRPETWEQILRVAKPGATLLAFGGTRTHHRLMCAIEDAGWEIRDCMMMFWVFATGFPKALDVAKKIDQSKGAERKVVGSKIGQPGYSLKHSGQGGVLSGRADGSLDNSEGECEITAPATDLAKKWEGWHTATKPAYEPIIMAMKPLDGTFAQNAEKWGVAGLNIDGCRIPHTTVADGNLALNPHLRTHINGGNGGNIISHEDERRVVIPNQKGRWPANIIFDEESAEQLDQQTGILKSGVMKAGQQRKDSKGKGGYHGDFPDEATQSDTYGDSGGASRFFYCAKASKKERGEGNIHPTVKPQALLRYLATLTASPTGGIVLDPFMGSGSTIIAALNVGREAVGIEKEEIYFNIANGRIENSLKEPQ